MPSPLGVSFLDDQGSKKRRRAEVQPGTTSHPVSFNLPSVIGVGALAPKALLTATGAGGLEKPTTALGQSVVGNVVSRVSQLGPSGGGARIPPPTPGGGVVGTPQQIPSPRVQTAGASPGGFPLPPTGTAETDQFLNRIFRGPGGFTLTRGR